MNEIGIYMVENKVNNKKYIGSSKNLRQRKNMHFYDLKHKRQTNPIFIEEYIKYGHENFEFKIIELCNKEDLLNKEQYYMDLYESYNTEKGYNISPSAKNTGLAESTKIKHKTNKIGEKNYWYKKPELNPMYGKKHSKEAREKMSKKKIGNKNNMFGKKHSEETKRKISEGIKNFLNSKNRGLEKYEEHI